MTFVQALRGLLRQGAPRLRGTPGLRALREDVARPWPLGRGGDEVQKEFLT